MLRAGSIFGETLVMVQPNTHTRAKAPLRDITFAVDDGEYLANIFIPDPLTLQYSTWLIDTLSGFGKAVSEVSLLCPTLVQR